MKDITINDGNQTWTRVDKRIARKAWELGKDVCFCPHKLYPFGAFRPSITSNKFSQDGDDKPFDTYTRWFAWYNCTNETGYYPAFYIKVG